jgi:serine/alanine adding enzyme
VTDVSKDVTDASRASPATSSISSRSPSSTPLVIEHFADGGAGWDEALAGLEGSSFCHRYGWRAVMENALGHETHWWAARGDDGEVEGLLPVVRVRSRLFGDYLVSMPFLNYGGPAGNPLARATLARHAAEHARRLGVDLLELRGRIETRAEGLKLNARKLTVIKELPETSEELWEKGIKAKVRSQIRRPMKEGMKIRFGADLIDSFYSVFSTTMRDLGTPVLPKPFFEAIQVHLGDSVTFAVVEYAGRPVAACCGLRWDGELEITWAGTSREHQRLAPNMLLYWGMMEEGTRLGCHSFNFGRCSPDSGTHRFKKQWGTEDRPLPWLQWSASGRPSTPTPDSPRFRLATSAWSKLPVPVTNLIGPRLSRLIP